MAPSPAPPSFHTLGTIDSERPSATMGGEMQDLTPSPKPLLVPLSTPPPGAKGRVTDRVSAPQPLPAVTMSGIARTAVRFIYFTIAYDTSPFAVSSRRRMCSLRGTKRLAWASVLSPERGGRFIRLGGANATLPE